MQHAGYTDRFVFQTSYQPAVGLFVQAQLMKSQGFSVLFHMLLTVVHCDDSSNRQFVLVYERKEGGD